MKKIKTLSKIILRVLYTWKKANFVIPSFNNKYADWIIYEPEFFKIRTLGSDNHQRVMGAYYYLFKNNQNVTIYTKYDVGKFSNKKILFFGETLNSYKFLDHSAVVRFMSENLIKQNNQVFPDTHEAALWENKAYMHKVFDERNIRTPKSTIFNLKSLKNEELINLSYPLLIKEEHSCSAFGVHKLNSYKEIVSLLKSDKVSSMNDRVICQELLNIRRDLRVIIVGDKIVLHYWRINLADEWKPTSTGHGSEVDFVTFPEQWRGWIMDTFKRLDMKTGAFDIAWQNDDLDTEPYILEVSPFYQPNPKPYKNMDINYGDWKKTVSLKNSYLFGFIDVMFDIQEELVNNLCKQFNDSKIRES